MNQSDHQYQLLPVNFAGFPIPIDSYFIIGSSPDSHLSLKVSSVEKKHCLIERTKNKTIIRDLNSKNGTWVNGTQISVAFLQIGDLIRVGTKELRFESSAPNKQADSQQLSSKNSHWNTQLKALSRYASTQLPILILGESGVGKEILAQKIHENSIRPFAPLVTINCGALAESLAESELFGHTKGAFTGAQIPRKGAFEAARGGTLFLDEVGELPLSIQPKILRALENQEIKPVGSDCSIKTDVRIIAATHPNLPEKVHDGAFRFDLFHRLNILKLTPPPLRNRMEDFETLLYSFAKDYRVCYSQESILALKKYPWPGNIRELKNFVLRTAATFPKKRIFIEDIQTLLDIEVFQKKPKTKKDYAQSLIKSFERDLIVKQLNIHLGNQRRAAEALGMPTSTLHDKIKSYKISSPKTKKSQLRVVS